ncbi:MAG: hypothetical protein LBU75_13385, partial [Desulfovibrio sp.]|nr:hypothetical protein [Desulfovibrio sp.]
VVMRGVPSAAASLRRKAPSGDLPGGMRMCTWLSVAWHNEGAFTFTHVAARIRYRRSFRRRKASGGDLRLRMRIAARRFFALKRRECVLRRPVPATWWRAYSLIAFRA